MAAVVISATASEPATAVDFCRTEDPGCRTVEVPLDRSGAVQGTVRLHVEVERTGRPVAPPLLAIGGAPGQAGTEAIRLIDLDLLVTPKPARSREGVLVDEPPRDVATMDLRGTGGSDPLRCDDLQSAGSVGAQPAAKCAAALGPRRGLYTASHSAEDVEAVRKALGAEKIALLGISYGARVALSYAQRYPDRVDRLVLQSPPPPEGGDLLMTRSFGVLPELVAARCAMAKCRRASPAPVADLVAIAARLASAPLDGHVVDGQGRRRRSSLTGFQLFRLFGYGVVDDMELPGFVRNARRGDVAPLLRAIRVARWYRTGQSVPAATRVFSAGAYAASVCEESVLPWSRSAPLAERAAQASAVVASMPPETFAPFGPRTALEGDLLELCREWPVASPAPEPPGVLPAVPALVLAGEYDVAAPIEQAEAVARSIPGARLLRVAGPVGGGDPGVAWCTRDAIRSFLAGGVAPASCRSSDSDLTRAKPPPPLSLGEVRPAKGVRGRAGRTLAAVRQTLRDGAGMLRMKFFSRLLTAPDDMSDRRLAVRLYGTPVRVGALRAGAYRLGFRRGRFALHGSSYVPGVAVSGVVAAPDGVKPMRGRLRVHGRTAAHGPLVLRNGVLRGRLGGREVRLRLGKDAFPDVSFGR